MLDLSAECDFVTLSGNGVLCKKEKNEYSILICTFLPCCDGEKGCVGFLCCDELCRELAIVGNGG